MTDKPDPLVPALSPPLDRRRAMLESISAKSARLLSMKTDANGKPIAHADPQDDPPPAA
ncbi:hypothetical protein BKA00_005822 [Actinomadura coerulea]|uniref:Uncharacterized protein n=1 Tax=Actinomadura coerulea TaxID=46159 RepID=A0A7X0G3R4_9ACTN|nr:hypothetical protein [Actinomadura coerulea]MBB6398908.1 hypothetical protein [Actinomadura coerulea]GGP98338.1 hypothetical protein GCM10010187_12440 [Actinomadura coerulea]